MQYGDTSWSAVTGAPTPANIAGKRMTAAFVSGTPYIFFAEVGCYTYDFVTNTMSASALTFDAPTVEADMIGIAANRGYLIAYSPDSVYWSSTLDPTDFVASLTTGAGGGQLEGARGVIVTIESVHGGFIVFTNNNAVSAVASDNSRFPYNFSEITGAGGVTDPDYVSYDANSAAVYAYTTGGLQQVSLKSATTVFPDVTDFISGDTSTGGFTQALINTIKQTPKQRRNL